MELISSNQYLSVAQMTGNAQYFLDYMTSYGWTKNAACAVLGNMQSESTINPGLWQNRDEGNMRLGFGLVQWTPATKFISWAESSGFKIGDIKGQCARIIYEVNNNIQWQKVTTSMTFREFTQSTAEVEILAELFELNYEQHAGAVQPSRKTQARYWYDTLTGGSSVINDVIALVKSRIGKNSYTQSALRENVFGEPTGYSDCSSLMWKCFQRAANIFIGTYTGEQITKGNLIWSNSTEGHVFTMDMQAQSGVVPGDLIFWGKSTSDVKHVEMYLGDNQLIGHGGGWGPTVKTASLYNHNYKLLQVRRYVEGGGSGGGGGWYPGGGGNGEGIYIVRWIPA